MNQPYCKLCGDDCEGDTDNSSPCCGEPILIRKLTPEEEVARYLRMDGDINDDGDKDQ